MKKEIKRTNWTRFFKQFNAGNQYRTATVTVERGKTVFLDERNAPFMGLRVTKKGRLIDGIDLHVARRQPEEFDEPIVSIKSPTAITLKKDKTGATTEMQIKADDDTIVSVSLTETDQETMQRRVVETIAYSLAERRGFAPGNEQNDWLEAEQKVRETASQFVG